MRPPCSTMNNRPLPSLADANSNGLRKPVATVRVLIVIAPFVIGRSCYAPDMFVTNATAARNMNVGNFRMMSCLMRDRR